MADDGYLPHDLFEDDDLEPDRVDLGGVLPSGAERAFLTELLNEVGIERVEDILIDFEDVNPAHLRAVRFSSLTEAVIWMYNIGVLGFGKVVPLPDGMFGDEVPDDTP